MNSTAESPAARFPSNDRHRRILLALGAISLLVAGGLFLAIAEDVATLDSLVRIDVGVANWLHAHARPAITRFLERVSLLNDVVAITIYTAALAGFLVMGRDWYWARRVVIVVAGGMLLNTALKLSYQRLRPEFGDRFASLTTYSFPSGHTAGATLFYGIFAIVLCSRMTSVPGRIFCVAFAAIMVTLVAFSRVYLGVHFMSDVAAAACASIAWTSFVLMAITESESRGRARRARKSIGDGAG